MTNHIIFLADEQETLNLGKKLAQICTNTAIIYLYGDLGTGKTTFSRGFLQFFGYYGRIKSPTYTLIESYNIGNITVHHIDLYRITNSEELEFIGMRDYFIYNNICLIEWPQQGINILPDPDIKIYINHKAQGREVYISTVFTLDNSLFSCFSKQNNGRNL